ncbi:TolC family outer membrane protein [Magnetococcus sp. PR-3]|uniref:TolC family outer membrane protein n=1 Tax=Magnetococcus sp. PR-3 TaxID=3120355 RepID=UPI002FCE0860
MLKHRSILALSLLAMPMLAGNLWAQEDAPISLQDAVHKALTTNPEVLAAWENKRANTQLVREAKAGLYPIVDLAAGYGREVSDNTTTRGASEGTYTLNRGESSATISQTLFDGFATYSDIKRAKATDNSTLHAFNRTSETVGFSAVEAFLGRLRHQELVTLSENNVKDHENVLDKLRELARGGQGKQADVEQTESRLFSTQKVLVKTQADMNIAGSTYERVIGDVPMELSKPERPTENIPESLDIALEVSQASHPLLQSSHADLTAAQQTKKQNKGNFYPVVTLDLAASNNGNVSGTRGYAQSMSAMLNVTYNVFNGGADLASYRESDRRINQTRETLALNQRTVRDQVINAWEQLEMSKRSIELADKQVAAQRKTVNSYLQEFDMAQRTHLDVLNAKTELYRAEVQQTIDSYSYITGIYRLWYAMGLLRDNLGLSQKSVMANR